MYVYHFTALLWFTPCLTLLTLALCDSPGHHGGRGQGPDRRLPDEDPSRLRLRGTQPTIQPVDV